MNRLATRLRAGESNMFDMIEVTSLNRPDTSWRFTDAAGHEHRWFRDGKPAESYHPEGRYTVPTLKYIEDYPGDDEYPASGHSECIECGEHVTPGRRADTERQFIRGLRYD